MLSGFLEGLWYSSFAEIGSLPPAKSRLCQVMHRMQHARKAGHRPQQNPTMGSVIAHRQVLGACERTGHDCRWLQLRD